MTIEELIVYGKKYLHSHEVKMLLSSVLGYDSLELLNHLDNIVSDELVEKYKKLVNARVNNYPLQYILGDVIFYGYRFVINENVLIPRFETEELVEKVIYFIESKFIDCKKVIDLGCGSGVIGITLAKKKEYLDVTCLDISEEALKVTKTNNKLLNANVKIIKGDMLEDINEKYDLIISNPPYIKTNEIIEDIVRKNEPSIALYGGDDGLLFYKKILSKAKNVLNKKFLVAFEIGCTQAEEIANLAKKYLDDIEINVIKDLSEKDRIMLIYSNNIK